MEPHVYVKCPDCDRRWSGREDEMNGKTEVQCKDCAAMPGWRNDFDSPPSPKQWAQFKRDGKK